MKPARQKILALLIQRKQQNPWSNSAGFNLGRMKEQMADEQLDFELWVLTGLGLVDKKNSFFQITAQGVLALEEVQDV